MGLLAAAFNPRPRASTPGPLDDFWYTRDISGFIAERSGAGIALSAESILRCGTVLAAVRFRGDSWAMCPPSTFKKTPSGRTEDPTHYSQLVLRNPNRWQTGNRWRHLNGVWLGTWGNAYNEIRSGRRSFAEELWPMHPSRVRILDQRADGSLLYEYRRPGVEKAETLGQESVLHFRDLSTDGLSGVETYRLIRNVVGIALLAEQHASTFLRKGSRVAGILTPTNSLTKEQRDVLRDSVNQDLGGDKVAAGTIGVLPYGVKLDKLGTTNRDGQYIELSDQVVGSILRFLGVPGVVVGYQGDKTATYASAKEFFESGGIKHCVLPILANVEAEEEKALLLPGDGRQIKHNLDVLMRANTVDRFNALFKAIGGPWMSVNEGRRIEDLNEDPDPRHNKILTPSNMAPELLVDDPPDETPPSPPSSRPAPTPPEEDEPGADSPEPPEAAAVDRERLRGYALDHAAALVSFEVGKLRAKAPSLARDREGWRAFVLELYGGHAEHVAKRMRISDERARAYCDRQVAAVLARGIAAAETWEAEIPPQLAALALEGA